MVRGISVRAAVYLCACFFASAVGRGQEVSADNRITGQVVDQQGGVLPETAVILLNTAGVRLQQTKTGQSGAFSFTALAAGEYIVGAERAGFAHAEQRVTLKGQAQARVSIEMKISGPGQQVTVTAEAGTFHTDQASTATKMNIPLNEIPQGVGVANQALIESQQDVRFADAAENISGVNRDILASGDGLGNALTIRGLPLGVFSNYYRDGFVFDGMAPSDTTDVERVEILKGPASVLYGRAASGGVINLITKEPLPDTHATFSLQADRYGSVRPTFDITGPLGNTQKLFYRLNAEFADTSSFRDSYHDRRYFVAPALTWKPDSSTTIRFLIEYLHARMTTDYGIPALGGRPAPVPISNFYGEPWQYSLLQNRAGGADVTRNLGPRWSVRSRFRATLTNWDSLDVSTGACWTTIGP